MQHRPRSLVGADLQARCRLSAEMPSLPAANSQQAVNHTVSGVRVRSKMARAVTEVRLPHPGHMKRPSPSRQRGRSPGRRSRRASAATPGSRGSPHRCGTRPGTRPRTADSACRHEDAPLPQSTPVKWIPLSPLMPSSGLCRGSPRALAFRLLRRHEAHEGLGIIRWPDQDSSLEATGERSDHGQAQACAGYRAAGPLRHRL